MSSEEAYLSGEPSSNATWALSTWRCKSTQTSHSVFVPCSTSNKDRMTRLCRLLSLNGEHTLSYSSLPVLKRHKKPRWRENGKKTAEERALEPFSRRFDVILTSSWVYVSAWYRFPTHRVWLSIWMSLFCRFISFITRTSFISILTRDFSRASLYVHTYTHTYTEKNISHSSVCIYI